MRERNLKNLKDMKICIRNLKYNYVLCSYKVRNNPISRKKKLSDNEPETSSIEF